MTEPTLPSGPSKLQFSWKLPNCSCRILLIELMTSLSNIICWFLKLPTLISINAFRIGVTCSRVSCDSSHVYVWRKLATSATTLIVCSKEIIHSNNILCSICYCSHRCRNWGEHWGLSDIKTDHNVVNGPEGHHIHPPLY